MIVKIVKRLKSLGSDGYLVKPFDQEQLFIVLKNVPRIKQQLMQ